MPSEYKISASLMCADLGNIEREIKKIEKAGIDLLHIDIMDGHFVPNFTFGPDLVKTVRKISHLPLDIHLMLKNPQDYISIWEPRRNDFISFHIETAPHPLRIIQEIKNTGARPALALNPATPLNQVDYLLEDLEMIVLMMVNPGFAGQKWIPQVTKKLEKLSAQLKKEGLKTALSVDGNIGAHNIPLLKKVGANVFVAGSSSIFRDTNYYRNTLKMRRLLNEKRR